MSIFKTESGSGEAVVIIHGWCLDHRWVKPIADQLKSRFKVISIDLPGLGQSAWQTNIDTIHDFADQLIPALPPKADFIACSIGGPIAISLASRYPERVGRLIGVGTQPKFIAEKDWIGVPQPGFLASIKPYIEEKGLETVLQEFIDDEFTDFTPKPDKYFDLTKLLIEGVASNNDAIFKGMEICDTLDVRDEFRALSCPIDLIFGSADSQVPMAAIGQVKGLSRHANTHLIEGAHHLPFWTHPEEFQRVLGTIIASGKSST